MLQSGQQQSTSACRKHVAAPGEGGWTSRAGRTNPGVSLQPSVHCSVCAPPKISALMLSLSPALSQLCCHNPALFLNKIWIVFLKAMASRFLESWRLPHSQAVLSMSGVTASSADGRARSACPGPALPVRLCSGDHHVL